MAKYFKIAIAQVRPLQCKNCYGWAMVRFNENTGMCFYRIGAKINVTSLSDALEIHKQTTSQKPYKVKPVQFAEFYGNELAIIDYAAEHILQSQTIDKYLEEAIKPYIKPWAGYNLKNVNRLDFINTNLIS